MKLKKLMSFIAAAALICSSSAFAVAVRIDPKSTVELPSRNRPNDVYFEEFTSVGEGEMPAGVSGGEGTYGYVTTALHNIGGGATKNCLEIVDTDDAAAYNGVSSGVSFPAQTGLVGAEIRYKYIPSEESNWLSFEILYVDSAGKMFSRTVVASANGSTHFNYGGTGTTQMEMERITHDGWYTLKYIIDFDQQKIDAMLTNETTGKVSQVFDSDYYSTTNSINLAGINFVANYYGGTYVVDYIRISKETERMEMIETELNIQKGIPERTTYITAPVSHAVADKINITLDGKFKYTTKNPKLQGEDVLVTAKNVASIFNLGYYMTEEGAVMQSGDKKFVVALDGSGIKNDGDSMSLSAQCIAEDNQVFIPIKDIAESLGYSCTYNAESNTVVIESAANSEANTEENIDEEKEAE